MFQRIKTFLTLMLFSTVCLLAVQGWTSIIRESFYFAKNLKHRN